MSEKEGRGKSIVAGFEIGNDQPDSNFLFHLSSSSSSCKIHTRRAGDGDDTGGLQGQMGEKKGREGGCFVFVGEKGRDTGRDGGGGGKSNNHQSESSSPLPFLPSSSPSLPALIQVRQPSEQSLLSSPSSLQRALLIRPFFALVEIIHLAPSPPIPHPIISHLPWLRGGGRAGPNLGIGLPACL